MLFFTFSEYDGNFVLRNMYRKPKKILIRGNCYNTFNIIFCDETYLRTTVLYRNPKRRGQRHWYF